VRLPQSENGKWGLIKLNPNGPTEAEPKTQQHFFSGPTPKKRVIICSVGQRTKT
jgi:hypothetical protein